MTIAPRVARISNGLPNRTITADEVPSQFVDERSFALSDDTRYTRAELARLNTLSAQIAATDVASEKARLATLHKQLEAPIIARWAAKKRITIMEEHNRRITGARG